MSVACTLTGCTVDQTGKCALEHLPDVCPNRLAALATPAKTSELVAGEDVSADAIGGAAVLGTPEPSPSFPPSTALGLDVVHELMACRYATMVGIVGLPDSGKTACLASLYLLVAHARLTGFSFSDSRSLMGFEEIARGARRWNEGNPPEQMTVHTQLYEDRRPGFLHVKLRRDADGRTIDLLLPDLPGEWTSKLIDTGDAERFDFLKSADVVWLMIDVRVLLDRSERGHAVHRLQLLIERLATLFGSRKPTALLVPTRLDHGKIPQVALDQIRKEGNKHGMPIEVAAVASFSDVGDVNPGCGIAQLVEATTRIRTSAAPFWPISAPKSESRSYLSFRIAR